MGLADSVPSALRSRPGLAASKLAQIRRVRFLPSGRVSRQHGDGNFRRSLLVPVGNPRELKMPSTGFRAGKNAGGGELVLLRDADDLVGPRLARCLRSRLSLLKVAAMAACVRAALRRGRHRQQIRVRMLHFAPSSRRLRPLASGFPVEFVGRCACSAPAKVCAHRDGEFSSATFW